MRRQFNGTLAAIGVSIALLAGLAWWDERNEGQAALEDFESEQAIVARSLVAQVETHINAMKKDAAVIAEVSAAGRPLATTILASYSDVRRRRADEPRLVAPADGTTSLVLSVPIPEGDVVDLMVPLTRITSSLATFDRPASQTLLLAVPRAADFYGVDGRRVSFPRLAATLERGAPSVRLTREEAAQLGLPPRIAVAGLASIDTGQLGRWGVATVVSAERLRDRERRARYRLIFGVLTAGGLVAAFGALAFRRQRRELELSRELALSALEREHETRLDHASRAATLGTLAMGIAHEISTPASVIQGRAEQLQERLVTVDERALAAARSISDQAQRILEVVRGFLGLARGDTGVAEPTSVRELVDGAVSLVEHRFAKARVALTSDVDGDAPSVRGDRRLLEHALTNLLLNACDACQAGGAVHVHALRREASLIVYVDDDGVGIPPEHAQKVMEPFFTTKELGKGSGLGLAITSEIVRAHRGELRLEARAPRGTRATLALPVAPPTSGAPADAHPQAADGKSGP